MNSFIRIFLGFRRNLLTPLYWWSFEKEKNVNFKRGEKRNLHSSFKISRWRAAVGSSMAWPWIGCCFNYPKNTLRNLESCTGLNFGRPGKLGFASGQPWPARFDPRAGLSLFRINIYTKKDSKKNIHT